MTDSKDHPEQDPAEGSRETIERDLQRQDNKDETPKNTSDGRHQQTMRAPRQPSHHQEGNRTPGAIARGKEEKAV